MKTHYDIIIVGAGAAGLACAEFLNERQKDFLVIEARSRIGGRVLSSGDTIPVEYGAEFIHGVAPHTLEWLRALNIPFYDVVDDHFFLKDRSLHLIEKYWDQLGGLMKKLAKGPHDSPVSDFLEKSGPPSSVHRDLFLSYVEGFHAADTHLISQKALSTAEQTDEHDLNGSQIFRPYARYGELLDGLALPFRRARIKTLTEVKKIKWKPGETRIYCTSRAYDEEQLFTAKKVVVTLPLGVLKSGKLQWEPEPKNYSELLENIHMGHVQKIIFKFKSRFWEGATPKPLSFIHASPKEYFPTWWTLQPVRSPYLVAWQGGPKAKELATYPLRRRVSVALKTLARLLDLSTSFITSQIETVSTHNWSHDRYSLGAYSFLGVGGESAVEKLKKPLDGTIYFAGEALISGGNRGTVEGALESGFKTARRICQN